MQSRVSSGNSEKIYRERGRVPEPRLGPRLYWGRTGGGGKLRILAIIDEDTSECLAVTVTCSSQYQPRE
ncbi:hypothetical protein ACFLVY_01225 [Chloroflexota bacterium]